MTDVLVCEDDPVVRSVITDLVEDQGGRVLAAVDSAVDAQSFLQRFPVDVVIIDLALRHGHGLEIIDHLQRTHPSTRIIVFTANDTLGEHDHDGVDVVVKPDFDRLAQVLLGAGERSGERRRPVRPVPARAGAVDSTAFYRLIADAHPDDVLLHVTVEGGHAAGDGDEVSAALRSALRGHDFVLQRDDAVVALLIGGGDDTVAALEQRVRATLPHLADRTTSAVVGTDPIATFDRLTS